MLFRSLVRVMRTFQPQLVITQNPERNWDRLPASHPDHMAAGEATVRALYPAVRNPYAYPELRNDEGLEAWTVSWLWLSTNLNPNVWVDITDHFARKIAALRAHASQTSHLAELEDMIRMWASGQAEAGGLPAGRYAEAFRQIKLPD